MNDEIDPEVAAARQKAEQVLSEIVEKASQVQTELTAAQHARTQAEEQLRLAGEAKVKSEQELAKLQSTSTEATSASETAQQRLNEINAILPQVKTTSDDVKGYAEKSQPENPGQSTVFAYIRENCALTPVPLSRYEN